MPVREIIERTPTSFEAVDVSQYDAADPFLIDHDCVNPSGHHFIADCSDVVCLHCARIAWR